MLSFRQSACGTRIFAITDLRAFFNWSSNGFRLDEAFALPPPICHHPGQTFQGDRWTTPLVCHIPQCMATAASVVKSLVFCHFIDDPSSTTKKARSSAAVLLWGGGGGGGRERHIRKGVHNKALVRPEMACAPNRVAPLCNAASHSLDGMAVGA